MIKKSAMLLLFLATSSVSILIYSAFRPGQPLQPAGDPEPPKCSGQCQKAVPHRWDIISESLFQAES